jgi:apolipoprotein N-acyltransferase
LFALTRSVSPVIPQDVNSLSQKISDFAAHAQATTGFRRALAAFAFGAFSSLAYAPLNIFPVLWLCFPALIFLLQGVTNYRAAFATGWSFAFGCFCFSFYWIAASMFVDIAQFWWAVPLALVGLPIFFAIYYGLAAMLLHKLRMKGLSGVVAFALLWFLADYARGHVFSGFPWNLEGYTWGRVLPVLQIVSVIGVYGLTLVTLIIASLPALLVQDNKRNRLIMSGSFVLLLVIAGWGVWRMDSTPVAMAPDVRLRLVQPNTNQADKWVASELEDHFRHLLDLSSAPVAAGEKPITHIIWPETASPFYLTEDVVHRRIAAAHVPENGVLLTGVVRRSQDEEGFLHYYNSLIAVDDKARVIGGYDKHHLVPFGEFIPLRRYLPLKTLVNGLDFSAGDGPHSLRVLGLPAFSPQICYEAIFSGDVADRDDRPQFLLNITNDGWYGNTAGPYQHLSLVKTRAVEEGLPLVRAANTGISGVTDPYGRVVARLGLSKTGFVDSDLPQALPPTVFSRYGELPLWVGFAILALGIFGGRVFSRKR